MTVSEEPGAPAPPPVQLVGLEFDQLALALTFPPLDPTQYLVAAEASELMRMVTRQIDSSSSRVKEKISEEDFCARVIVRRFSIDDRVCSIHFTCASLSVRQ
jgi:hypothetical protein